MTRGIAALIALAVAFAAMFATVTRAAVWHGHRQGWQG